MYFYWEKGIDENYLCEGVLIVKTSLIERHHLL
jgi:hypothetical protein